LYQRGYRGSSGFGFGLPVTPPIIKQLIIINVGIFILFGLSGGALRNVEILLMITPAYFWKGMFWQPFTYMFLHASIAHVGFNMFALWMFGTPIALIWGARRFLRYYLLCGTGAGLIIATMPYIFSVFQPDPMMARMPTLGASGAIMGVILAYCLTWPDRTIQLLFPPIPIKAIWFIPLVFVLEFAVGPENVSHTGHLGGVLIGWLLLRKDGHSGTLLPTKAQLRMRWERYKMRKRLRDANRYRP